MFFERFIPAVYICFYLGISDFTTSSDDTPNSSYEEEELIATTLKTSENVDLTEMVAKLDISFEDNTHRTCTGAIIHEKMVITAGHCFLGESFHSEHSRPDISDSYVIIGSNKRFDTNNEIYMLMERIITHPELQQWRNDLAMVRTFDSMISDNVAAIVPLVSEVVYTSSASDITVLSWGPILPFQDSGGEDSCEEEGHTPHRTRGLGYTRMRIDQSAVGILETPSTGSVTKPIIETAKNRRMIENLERSQNVTGTNSSDQRVPNTHQINRKAGKDAEETRQMTLEEFVLIDVLSCANFRNKLMPDMPIPNTEVECYDSKTHYVSDADAGAPAFRQGELEAITVGGLKNFDEHMAIGMRLSHYCPWIMENLPDVEGITFTCWAEKKDKIIYRSDFGFGNDKY